MDFLLQTSLQEQKIIKKPSRNRGFFIFGINIENYPYHEKINSIHGCYNHCDFILVSTNGS